VPTLDSGRDAISITGHDNRSRRWISVADVDVVLGKGGSGVNGDYIEVTGVESETEVLWTLVHLLGSVTATQSDETFSTITIGSRTVVFVDFEAFGARTALLAIADLGNDDQERRGAAKNVYDALATATTWPLRWTSDTPSESITSTPGPEAIAG
jgi:hypothetical protein